MSHLRVEQALIFILVPWNMTCLVFVFSSLFCKLCVVMEDVKRAIIGVMVSWLNSVVTDEFHTNSKITEYMMYRQP